MVLKKYEGVKIFWWFYILICFVLVILNLCICSKIFNLVVMFKKFNLLLVYFECGY